MAISRGFKQQISRTTGLQLKLLILIESPNIFHWTEAAKKKINKIKQNKMGVVLGQNLGQIRSNLSCEKK